jgi:glycosyltransferase involved in cell wall biosynthesis
MLSQKQSDIKIAIVIPAFNEGKSLMAVVASLLAMRKKYSIIVVDDGSSPSLRENLQQLPVFYLRHRVNLGQGAAIQTGIGFARKIQADILVTFDADGQHQVDDLTALIEPLLQEEADVVLGSRFLQKKQNRISFGRKLVLQTARYINFFFSGLMLSDAHNGLRAFNKKALEKINITENRMAHASEILFQVRKHRLRFTEVPVHISYTSYSDRKGQSDLDSVKVFIDIVLHKLFG